MVVLKENDWVLVNGEGFGKITLIDFHPQYHLVLLMNGMFKFAVLRHQRTMTKIDEALYPILSDSTRRNHET